MPIRSSFSAKSKFSICSVCNQPVELPMAKVDDSGQPVHDECYAQKAGWRATQRPPPDDIKDREKSLSQAIVTFLDSRAHSGGDLKRCPVCGSDLEYRDCTLLLQRAGLESAPSCLLPLLCCSGMTGKQFLTSPTWVARNLPLMIT